jgi:hypothetical protein
VGVVLSRGTFVGIGPWFHASNGVQGRLDVRAPMTHLTSQSPGHMQARAPRVFHLDRHAIAARVFDLMHHVIEQALAAWVFHLNHHAIEQTPTPRVLRLNRNDFVPRVFHLNHRVIWETLAPDRFFSELRSS